LLSSVSLYAIARHAYQEAEYDEAIIALEESLALRLFAYADQKTLDRWQQGLVMPGSLFRRQKMDLANMLVLRSDCLVQLARVSCSIAFRTATAAAVFAWQRQQGNQQQQCTMQLRCAAAGVSSLPSTAL
jgi:hypothetical protein